jgi:hypothetical protein
MMARETSERSRSTKQVRDLGAEDVFGGRDEKASGSRVRQVPIQGFSMIHSYTETAAVIAAITPALVRDTQAAHQRLQIVDPFGNVSIGNVFKLTGHAYFTIVTEFIDLPWDLMLNIIGKQHDCIIATTVLEARLPRPVFEIVTNAGGRTKSHTGYRLWLGPDGDSVFLPVKPRQPSYRIRGGKVCRSKEETRTPRERKAGFSRADRMIRSRLREV